MIRILIEIGTATFVVFLVTWLLMQAASAIFGMLEGTRPHFSVRRLLVYMTAIAIILALTAALVRNHI